MNLVTRTTEYPNGVIVTESFENDPDPVDVSLYDQAQDASPVASEPFTVEFYYHGELRTVQNPQIIRGMYSYVSGYNALLEGVEVQSGQYKNFSLKEIVPV